MITIYKGIPYTTNCDWLQFSIVLPDENPELICPDGYRIEVLQGNNIYRHRIMVFDTSGRKWYTMLWSPYSSVLKKYIAVVQFSNWVLYSDYIYNCWKLVQDVLGYCDFNSMGRIDLCMDFVATEHHIDVLKQLNSGNYYVQGKREGSSFWHSANKADVSFEKKMCHCQSWGSKTSDIKVKVYFKSREQGIAADPTATPEKQWIVDEWMNAGMDVQNVWRIEFSLTGASCLRDDERLITIDDVCSAEWIAGVLQDMLDNRFVIRKNQGRRTGHKNLDERVPFLELPIVGRKLKWQESRDMPKAGDAITMLRKLFGMLELSVVRCNRDLFADVANTITNLVHMEHLEEYFERKIGGNLEERLQAMYDECGEGIVEKSAPPAMFYE